MWRSQTLTLSESSSVVEHLTIPQAEDLAVRRSTPVIWGELIALHLGETGRVIFENSAASVPAEVVRLPLGVDSRRPFNFDHAVADRIARRNDVREEGTIL